MSAWLLSVATFSKKSWMRRSRIPLVLMFLSALSIAALSWSLVHDKYPPAGMYIAIGGVMAAIMAARGDGASAFERSMWVLLITSLVAAEISDLYHADRKQNTVFEGITKAASGTAHELSDSVHELRSIHSEMSGQFKLATTREQQIEGNLETQVSAGQRKALITHQEIREQAEDLSETIRISWILHSQTINSETHDLSQVIMSGGTQQGIQRQKDEIRNENSRYEEEFNEKIRPQLIDLITRILHEQGKIADPNKILADYGITNASSAMDVMERVQREADALRP